MVLAVLVFARFYWVTHSAPPQQPRPEVRLVPIEVGGDR
jgi:hypothetical protein